MLGRPSILTALPDIVTGYPIDGEWEVVVPIGRTNEITNPSFELATTGYTAGAGSLARSTAKQYHGTYSAIYTPSAAVNDGFFYASLATTALQFRAISCKFWGQANVPYALTIATSAGVDLTTFAFKGQGRWQWIWLYWMETSTTTRRVYFRKNGSTDVHPFYVDGVQSEVINTGETVSTYIDGDQLGFLANQYPYPYGWNGIPHASSSYRLATTRAGGYVIPFKRFGFLLTAIIGLGLAQVQNVSTEFAQADGGYPNYTRKPSDQFSIVGNMSEGTYNTLRNRRGGLSRYFDRDLVANDQNMLLRYRHMNSCDVPQSDAVSMPCRYRTGWEGQTNNHFAQVVTMTFDTYLPNVSLEMEAGAALNVQTSLTNSIGIAARSATGVWSIPVTSLNAFFLRSIFYSRSGRLYISGNDFTTINGVSATRIAYLDPSTGLWTAMGTGLTTAQATTWAEGADGAIYVGGIFGGAGGVANTARLAKWDPTTATWSSITPAGSANNSVTKIIAAPDNTLIVFGSFTTINGVAANYVAKYTIATGVWTASYGAGPGGAVQSGAIPPGSVYPTIVSAAVPTVRRWDGAAWTTIGTATGTTPALTDVIIGFNGITYVAGLFHAMNGVTAYNVAQFNNTAWSAMGQGLLADTELPPNVPTNDSLVNALAQLPNGNVLAVGSFGDTGFNPNSTTLSGLATFDGATWSSRDAYFSPGGAGTALAVHADGRLAVLHDGNPVLVAGQTVVNNVGTARSYPTITIKGPTTGATSIYQLADLTTGRTIFLNLPIIAGEVDTFSFQPDNLIFKSSVYGSVASAVLPGSNEAEFFLLPGNNTIAVYSLNSTVVATIRYNPEYLSLDDLP